MSRRPRRHRPPLLDDPAPARRTPAPAGPAEPRPRTPREQLVAGRVAGPHVHLSREGVLQQARALLRGDPQATLGLVEPGAVTLDDVRAAVAATHGYTFDTPRAAIDPDCTIAGAERAIARLFEVAASGGRIAFATGRPASLLVHYQQLARAAQHAGADIVALEQYGPFHAHGRGDRYFRWFDGVAVLTDGDSLFVRRRCRERRGVVLRRRAASTSRSATGDSPRRCSPTESRPSRSPTSTRSRSSVAAARGRPVHRRPPRPRRALRPLTPPLTLLPPSWPEWSVLRRLIRHTRQLTPLGHTLHRPAGRVRGEPPWRSPLQRRAS